MSTTKRLNLITTETRVGSFYIITNNKGDTLRSGFGSPDRLIKKLPGELSRHKIDKITCHKYQNYIKNYFSGNITSLDFIAVNKQKGTTFQEAVWEAIREVGYGSTASYSEIAKKIRHPKAYRAVATACKNNPLPILVPCHRIIKNDGALGEYSYGTKIKNYLVNLEKQNIINTNSD